MTLLFLSVPTLSFTVPPLPFMPVTVPSSSSSAVGSLSSALSAADPFSDSVFAAAEHEAAAVATAVDVPFFAHGPLATAIAFYVVSMFWLTVWEEYALPKLQDRGLMPTIPGTLRYERLKRLSPEQRSVPWTTPLTCDRQIPPLERIEQKAVRVSQSKSGVIQFILRPRAAGEAPGTPPVQVLGCPDEVDECDVDDLGAVCRVSTEFSTHYGKRVYICKRSVGAKKRSDDAPFAA